MDPPSSNLRLSSLAPLATLCTTTNPKNPALPTQMQRSSDRTTLESLPTEIKLLILCQLDDQRTLHNLTSASTFYGEIERDRSEEIFTAITINYIVGHGFDPFSAHDVIAVSFGNYKVLEYDGNSIRQKAGFRRSEKDLKDFWDAIQEFHKACQLHKSTGSTKSLRIPTAICTPLWQIVHAVGWTVHDDLPLDSNGLPDYSRFLEFRYFVYDNVAQPGAQGVPRVSTGYLHGKPEFKCYASTYGSVFLGAHTSQWTENFKTNIDGAIKRAKQCLLREMSEGGVKGMIIDSVGFLCVGIGLAWWEYGIRHPKLGLPGAGMAMMLF